MNIRKLLIVAVLALALVPAMASAQQTQQIQTGTVEDRTNQDAFVPFIGYNASGALVDVLSQATSGTSKPRTYGGSILFWGPGILAGELDVGYSPNFFEHAQFQGLPLLAAGSTSSLTTLTLNFVLGPTFFIGENMRVRPYALIGGGLMRSEIPEFAEHLSFKDPGNLGVIDIAGGVYFYPIKRIGVRADVRYFKGVGANDSDKGYGILDWNVYRITIGAAIAF